MIKPVLNHIIFKFKEETSNGMFVETTEWGFVTGMNSDKSCQNPRLAQVVACGPDVVEVKEGDMILIEPLKWTNALTYENSTMWRTDESCVIGIMSDD